MTLAKSNKIKWTVTVDTSVCEQIDKCVMQRSANRSAVVEEALRLWLAKQNEEYDEAYFSANASELNADAEVWVKTTTESSKGWLEK